MGQYIRGFPLTPRKHHGYYEKEPVMVDVEYPTEHERVMNKTINEILCKVQLEDVRDEEGEDAQSFPTGETAEHVLVYRNYQLWTSVDRENEDEEEASKKRKRESESSESLGDTEFKIEGLAVLEPMDDVALKKSIAKKLFRK